jgi:MFS family permease
MLLQVAKGWPARIGRVYYGWWIVAAWVALNVYWAGTLLYGLTVFFTPIRQSFGLSAGLLALIFSLANILAGLVSPLTGAWFDSRGPRHIMLTACCCGALGLLWLSRVNSLPMFIAAFGVVSLGYSLWSGTGMLTVGLWFVRRRGLAMGVVVAGSSLGGLLVPIWHTSVLLAGWRSTFAIAGLGMIVIGMPASLVLRHRPSLPSSTPGRVDLTPHAHAPTPGAERDGDSGFWAAIGTWQFWTISAVASVILAGSSATTVLMLPRLQEAGVRSDIAVGAATAAVLLGVLGRPAAGMLADRGSIPRLAAWLFVLQAAGLLAFAFAPQHLLLLLLFVAAFGLTNDGVRMLASLLLVRYFGPRAFGRILGMHLIVLIPGRVLGPVVAGSFHDAGRGYGSAFALLAVASLAMTLPALLLRQPRSPALVPTRAVEA